jgi:predicted Fe-Mo cluster-binding NifX family protein
MKIAIATETADPASSIIDSAARAPVYQLYDKTGKLLQVLENPCAHVERGAGPCAAEFLQQHGVTTIVAGQFGERFSEELETYSITARHASGSITAVLQEMTAN